MVTGHKIKESIKPEKFLEQIQEYKEEDIETTKHTFFHFSEKQRNILNDKWAKAIILNEIPIRAGIQYNGLWAVFYKYNKEILRFILDIQPSKIYIVTIYKIDESQMPKI